MTSSQAHRVVTTTTDSNTDAAAVIMFGETSATTTTTAYHLSPSCNSFSSPPLSPCSVEPDSPSTISASSPFRRDRYEKRSRRRTLEERRVFSQPQHAHSQPHHHHQQHHHHYDSNNNSNNKHGIAGNSRQRRQATMDEKKEDGIIMSESSTSTTSSSASLVGLCTTSTVHVALENAMTTSSGSTEEAVEVITTTTTIASSSRRRRLDEMNHHHVLLRSNNNNITGSGINHLYDVGGENDDDDDDCFLTPPPPIARPLHHDVVNHDDENHETESDEDNVRYYRISYRGVVALLSEPSTTTTNAAATRSGSYLGFGEIFASTWEMPVANITHNSNSNHENSEDSCSTIGPPTLTARRSCREWEDDDEQQHENDDDEAIGYFANTQGLLVAEAAAAALSPPRSIISSHNAGGGGGGSVSSMDTFQTRSTTTATATSAPSLPLPLAPQIPDYLPSSKYSPGTSSSSRQQQHHQHHDGVEDNDDDENLVIRVDHLLTGGYAMDAPPHGAQVALEDNIETPKRSNVGDLPVGAGAANYYHHHQHHAACRDQHKVSASAPPENDDATKNAAPDGEPCTADKSVAGGGGLGYLFSRRKGLSIVERIARKPKTEEGKFHYKVISSIPLPILTGPCWDAPKTKAMVLPGTLHEVSLRVTLMEEDNDETVFLRLAHRKGWIADRKVTSRKGQYPVQYKPVVRVVTDDSCSTAFTDDCSVVSSVASTFIVAPGVAARSRHRPPRRRREGTQGKVLDKTLPRHIDGSKLSSTNYNSSTPSKTTTKGGTAFNEAILTPSSNMSILSDDSSFDHGHHNNRRQQQQHGTSPDVSYHSAAHDVVHGTANQNHVGVGTSETLFYLIRVTAPRGLKILDAPHFQVNSLIRGTQQQQPGSSLLASSANVSSSHLVSKTESSNLAVPPPPKSHYSIFQTMSGGRLAVASSQTTGNNPAIFDATMKTRILPRGAVFEASKRMESTGAYSQGAGLIKLSDNSGWAIVPRKDELDQQYRNYHIGVAGVKEGEASSAYEEVGHAIIESPLSNNDADRVERSASNNTVWIRVATRPGVVVCCPPPPANLAGEDSDTSPTSSRGSSAINGSHQESILGPMQSHDSDVTSSVASAFVDAMLFRTPKKKDQDVVKNAVAPEPPPRSTTEQHIGTIISCGMCVEVERWSEPTALEKNVEFVRLVGGQGWIPLRHEGRTVASKVPRPDFRFGSFWFRVQASRGIKVRLGPSKIAPSIKSDQGVHFRFECGEFLRASEIMTIFSSTSEPVESFAKLYRNRHTRLHGGHEDFRQLPSLTAQAEWVQVYSEKELYLDECAAEPRIERHKQGWKYIVIPENGVPVRKGPSFAAQTTGVRLSVGESVTVNERVTPSGDKIQWLRMKDGEGWLHDVSDLGEQVMIEHSLRHRAKVAQRPVKASGPREEIAYNTIIARLFHSDVPVEDYGSPSKDLKGLRR